MMNRQFKRLLCLVWVYRESLTGMGNGLWLFYPFSDAVGSNDSSADTCGGSIFHVYSISWNNNTNKFFTLSSWRLLGLFWSCGLESNGHQSLITFSFLNLRICQEDKLLWALLFLLDTQPLLVVVIVHKQNMICWPTPPN